MPSKRNKGTKKKKSSAKGKHSTTFAAADGTELLSIRRHTDEELFGLGYKFYLGECSICMHSMPLDESQRYFTSCCMNGICKGCALASQLADLKCRRTTVCAFCRQPEPDEGPRGDEIKVAQIQKRVDAGDAEAYFFLGQQYYRGQYSLPQDLSKAIELWEVAAKLGSVEANFNLASTFRDGGHRVKKNMNKAVYHYEIAAMGGHHLARRSLGNICLYKAKEEIARRSLGLNQFRPIEVEEEAIDGLDRALKHWLIAAKMGDEGSLSSILVMYKTGYVTKDDYTQALLGYQNAMEEIKSDERSKAKNYKYE